MYQIAVNFRAFDILIFGFHLIFSFIFLFDNFNILVSLNLTLYWKPNFKLSKFFINLLTKLITLMFEFLFGPTLKVIELFYIFLELLKIIANRAFITSKICCQGLIAFGFRKKILLFF